MEALTDEQLIDNIEERVNWLEDQVSILAGHTMEVNWLLKPAKTDSRDLRKAKIVRRLDILEMRVNALSQSQDKALKLYIVNIIGEELRK